MKHDPTSDQTSHHPAVKAVFSNKRGVTLIEYALIGSLVAIALVAVMNTFEGSISSTIINIGSSL